LEDWWKKSACFSIAARHPHRASRRKEHLVKILYVEDNDDNVYVLKSRLTRAGFTVLIATDGAQGLAMAATDCPDLIVMDLSLPVLDGWEATKQIKAQPATRHIPVIALSAHAMSGDREKALAAGCDDFDTKPVEMSRFLEKIRVLLPKAEAP
jgi:CheY-like chemotaxis protein